MPSGSQPDQADGRKPDAAQPINALVLRRRSFNLSLLAAVVQVGFGTRVLAGEDRPRPPPSRLTADSTRLISEIA